MKLFRALLTILMLLAVTPLFAGTIVQSNSNTESATTDYDVTFSSSPATGNTIVVSVWINDGTTVTSCADTESNTYTAHTDNPQGSNVSGTVSPWVSIFYSRNITGGASFEVTCTMGASGTGGINVIEISGLDNAATVQEASNSDNGAAYTGGSVTLVGAGVIIGTSAMNEFSDLTAGVDWTLEENNRTFPAGHMVSRVVGSGGSYEPDGTFEFSNNWSALTFGFEDAGGGGGSDSPLRRRRAANDDFYDLDELHAAITEVSQ